LEVLPDVLFEAFREVKAIIVIERVQALSRDCALKQSLPLIKGVFDDRYPIK
jgi:hypothetical protein